MMRYQTVSPDYLPPLTNGTTNKPFLRPSPSNQDTTTTTSINRTVDVPKGFSFRSTLQQQQQQQDPSLSPKRRGGDVLLQWGQRKRSRNSRSSTVTTITTTPTDDSSSSSGGQGQAKIQSSTNNKLQRRSSVNPSMPPPPVFSSRNPRNSFVAVKPFSSSPSSQKNTQIMPRNLEDRLIKGSSPSRTNNNNNNRMVSRSAKRSPDQTDKRSSLRDHHNQKQNGLDHHQNQRVNRSESAAAAQTHVEIDGERDKAAATTQVEVVEWPRIYIALSRKEKEEDFLVMKGTKLPHRPRKRAKNIDKALQYCFPGMWLSDLTKTRYEVRERKNVKKQKRRGLKGMENLDSDSE